MSASSSPPPSALSSSSSELRTAVLRFLMGGGKAFFCFLAWRRGGVKDENASKRLEEGEREGE